MSRVMVPADRRQGRVEAAWTVIFFLVLFHMLTAGSAIAQKASSSRDDAWRQANELHKQGDADVVRGDTGAALTKYRAAFDTFKRLSGNEPGNSALQANLSVSHDGIGGIQQAQGDLGAALVSYKASHTIRERLAASDPKNAGWQRDLSVSHDRIGDIQEAQGDLGAALVSYKAAIKADPKYDKAYKSRGAAYTTKGDFDLAIADYTKAIELDPKDASYFSGRGTAFENKGDFDRAIADAVKAVELAPKSARYVRSLGVARFNKGAFKEAAADLLRSLELNDDSYAMLFRYLARQRASETAAAELEANAGRLKDKKWPYAVIELYLGKRSPEATLDAAGKLDEKCEAQFYIGQWHILQGDRAAAAAPLKAAVDTCPKGFIEYVGAVVELKRLKP